MINLDCVWVTVCRFWVCSMCMSPAYISVWLMHTERLSCKCVLYFIESTLSLSPLDSVLFRHYIEGHWCLEKKKKKRQDKTREREEVSEHTFTLLNYANTRTSTLSLQDLASLSLTNMHTVCVTDKEANWEQIRADFVGSFTTRQKLV